MRRFTYHVFVCQNHRPQDGRPSCGGRGADAIVAGFRQALGENPALWDRVAVTPTACLGPCFEGPNAVVYPDGTWYRGLTAADVPEIVREHLGAGRPVARLTDADDD